MTVLLDQFVQSLVDSGLMTGDEVQAFVDRLPPDDKPDSAQDLARLLYRDGRLTKFQAQAVYQGKTKLLMLGNYVVRDKIGQGGMGHVYEAEHRRMRRKVALKVLPSALMRQPGAVERFQREVTAAARLLHPNIVTAFDADEAGGVHFLVMEHVDGCDLDAVVQRRGPVSISRALDYVLQAARGLDYAHNHGVVHRDVKPSNLLLDRSGTVKILDMGLARLEQEAGPGGATADAALTQSGQVMGTIDYMPPEQAEDTHRADHRADVYSLGCTLFYLLTGRPVYRGETLTKKILGHREGAIPSLREIREDVPERLDEVFQRMVAKRPDQRHPSMSQVAADLEACRAELEAEVTDTLSLSQGPTGGGDTGAYQAAGLAPPGAKPPSGDKALQEWLNAELPELPTALRSGPRKRLRLTNRQIVIGSVAVGLATAIVLLGILLRVKTPEGTIVVTVSEPDAEISVDDGRVTVTSPGGDEPVQIEVVEGEHTLKVTKGGFETFTEEFAVRSGGKETIRVVLNPKRAFAKEVASGEGAPHVKAAEPVVRSSTAQVEPTTQQQSSDEENAAASVLPAALGPGGNWALEFDGTTNYVFPQMQYSGTPPITVEAFVTPLQEQEHVGAVLGVGRFNLERHGNWWRFGGLNDQGEYVAAGSTGPTNRGQEVHIAAVWDGATLTLYIDGMLHGETAYVCDGGKTGYLGIGTSRGRQSHAFAGIIDEVRISNIARYTEDFTPQRRFEPDEHTLALYHFDEGSGDVLHDSSGNGHDGKIVGAKWVRVDGPKPKEAWPGLPPATHVLANGWRVGEPVNLGPVVNSAENDGGPFVSADGLTLIFSSRRPDGQGNFDLWMSSRTSPNEPFGKPINLGTTVNSQEWETRPALSRDGLMLLFGSSRHGTRGNQDLWMSRRASAEEPFGAPVNLGSVVNSSATDCGPSLSADGLTLFFVSNREGGHGGYDLWRSRRRSVNEPFGEPINLGAAVNSSANEMGAVVSRDGLTLFFQGERPDGDNPQGHSDLWMSSRSSKSEEFGSGVNLGPAVNSSAHEYYGAFWDDGRMLFFSSDRPGGHGDRDLWVARIQPPAVTPHPPSTTQPPLATAPSEAEERREAPKAISPDRRAAEWVLGIGGTVSLLLDGGRGQTVTAIDDLPQEDFVVRYVDVCRNPSVNDQSLRNLRGLMALEVLGLDGTAIGDKGLENLGELPGLRRLDLQDTQVTDEGLRHLEAMPGLRTLDIRFTPTSDAGLEHFKSLKDLAVLFIPSRMSFKAIASFPTLRNLTVLTAFPEHLTAEGIAALNRLPKLHVLGLHHAGIDDRHVPALSRLSNLGRMFVGVTSISEQGVAALRKALPDCQIETENDDWQKCVWDVTFDGAQPPLAIAPFTPDQARQYQYAWAYHLHLPVEQEVDLGGGVKLTMVLIPPGEFMMGSSEAEIEALLEEVEESGSHYLESYGKRILSEGPQHKVRLSRPFYLAAHEVTVGQFRAFVEATGYKTKVESSDKLGAGFVEVAGERRAATKPEFSWRNVGIERTEQHPVVNLTWDDAVEFCRFLGESEGSTCRLPTEAEWEYACRAGSTTRWFFGDDEAELRQYAWSAAIEGHYRKPVGQLAANGFGLYDVYGNVREWCLDFYSPDYYGVSPVDDPTCSSGKDERVSRGGSAQYRAWAVRSAFRFSHHPNHVSLHLGFRPAMLLDATDLKRAGQPPAGE